MQFVSRDEILNAFNGNELVAELTAAVRTDVDPALDAQRVAVPLAGGEYLLMPSERARNTGVKVLTVSHPRVNSDIPRIQGLYLLFDAKTLSPSAVLDGPALTQIRTPAMSVAALALFAARFQGQDHINITIFGTGIQGQGHAQALQEFLQRDGREVRTTFVTPSMDLVSQEVLDRNRVVLAAQSQQAVQEAHVVVCCTTASDPLFDADWVRPGAVVIAMGSHEVEKNETPPSLYRDAFVVVEDVATAMREAGDVVIAIAQGQVSKEDLHPFMDLVKNESLTDIPHDRVVIFKGTGMPWQDLVAAEYIMKKLATSQD